MRTSNWGLLGIVRTHLGTAQNSPGILVRSSVTVYYALCHADCRLLKQLGRTRAIECVQRCIFESSVYVSIHVLLVSLQSVPYCLHSRKGNSIVRPLSMAIFTLLPSAKIGGPKLSTS